LEDKEEVANGKTTQEEAKQVSLLEEDEDEIAPIKKLIRKQKVVNPIDKGKSKK
jgi:hypothetical protein